MKPAIKPAVSVRLVTRIDDGPPLHGIDALQGEEKIAALADLKSRLEEPVFLFPPKFTGAAHDLARHEESFDAVAKSIPAKGARHEIIFVATVAVPREIGVVFVES